ncbi:MAG: hypothetical protein M1835_002808, partial [Candelina submexicana]
MHITDVGGIVSYLDCSAQDTIARFHGNLDIATLGGAGFASQRTTGEDRCWDLSAYDGLELDLVDADGARNHSKGENAPWLTSLAEKRYTLILKDELLPPNPENDREQSTISYEFDFRVEDSSNRNKSTHLFVPWSDLKATYRGRGQKDAPALNRSGIKRMSLMMR